MPVDKDQKRQLLEIYRKVFWSDPKDEFVFLTLAESYIQLGAFEEAIPLLEKVLKMNPRNPVAHIQLGWALLEEGILGEAMVHYALCEINDSSSKLDAGSIAAEHLSGEDQKAALEALREAHAKVPDSLWFRYLLAWYAKANGKFEEAIGHYCHLLFHARKLAFYHEVKHDWYLIKEKVSESKEKLIKVAYSRAEREFENKNYAQAVTIFEALSQLMEWDEQKADLLKKTGRCYEELNDLENAIAQYQHLVGHYQSAEAWASAHLKLSSLYREKGDHKKKREHAERAVLLYQEAGIAFTPNSELST